ncbi:hypothetical protein [Nocardia jejuensis]|uniref:hypothetical protein n=1 Tax=Nocardia jejuensis TaxID=328049 RepID=UPI000833A457|nr:hypothetical protein [Nocardia jejuensis]
MGSVIGGSGERYGVDETSLAVVEGVGGLYRCWDARGRERVYIRYEQRIVDGRWVRAAALHGRAVVWAAEQSGGVGVEGAVQWPLDTMSVGNAVAGVIMPVVPARFRTPDGRGRTLQSLCAPQRDAALRVAVLIRVCDIFAMLDSDGFVYGEPTPGSIVWCADPVDAYLLGGDRLRPPRGAECDRLGVAVLVFRGLFPRYRTSADVLREWSEPGCLPVGLAPGLRVLFERASSGAETPEPTEWRSALMSTFLSPDGSAFLRGPLRLLDQHAEFFRDTVIGLGVASRRAADAPAPHQALEPGSSVGRVAATAGVVMALLAGAIGIGMGTAVLSNRSAQRSSDARAPVSVFLGTEAAITPEPVRTASVTGGASDAVDALPGSSDPYAAVVQAYVAASNRRDFPMAWELGGRAIEGGDWDRFVRRFDGLDREVVTVFPTGGPTVSIHLDTYRSDGSVLRFDGFAVVSGSAIVAWSIHRVS